ncbi:MAG: hypothetical protein HQ500_07100 [Flavobacteriales bacterium]|nr:hypothetical protein [Flavobacteriales bacterium]
MKKAFASILIAGLLLFASCGHDDTSNEEAAYTLTVEEVVNAFLEDEGASNLKYNDLIIEVSGPVMEVIKENGMITGLKLSNDEFNIVNCTFQNPVEPARAEGGSVTVKGICSGFLGDASSMLPGGTVELKRAAIVD